MKKTVTMDIVRFCAIECKMQMSGEISVWNMIEAWFYAQEASVEVDWSYGDGNIFTDKLPTVGNVLVLGRMVEPYKNQDGFRKCGIRIGSDVKMDWQNVPYQMVDLMDNVHLMSPEGFFKDYETIHPFVDGNGRTGAILFNWLNGTLDDPVWPPNYWNDPRRTIGYGA